MGHIDHGKSTLLDYIRKTNVADKEAGGITQSIAAYEVEHEKEGKKYSITFLDTPGHEAFAAMRSSGVSVADIAILVVSAEDGVKPQTLEALRAINTAHIPFIVAINKIDKPEANLERTKNSLAENEIYIEGYGGTIPAVPISAKTGEGVPELLDMMLLQAELEDLKGDTEKPAEGVIIQTLLDKRKGICSTLIIKDGTLRLGNALVADTAISSGRMFENFLGKKITEATFSSPVRVIGWSELPVVGSIFQTFESKKVAEEVARRGALAKQARKIENAKPSEENGKVIIPLIIKTNVSGGLEAIEHELRKLNSDLIEIRIIQKSLGEIGEGDVKLAISTPHSLVVGFSTKVENAAAALAERSGVAIQTFDIIYKLTEYVATVVAERTPRVEVEESLGVAKIQKLFSHVKDRQVVGGKVEKGKIKLGCIVKILRRESEIGRGVLKELQQQKQRTSEVEEGREFGTLIESKIALAPGDRIECVEIVKK